MIEVFPDFSLLIQIVNFLFLVFALNVILFKPVRSIITERKTKVSALEQSIHGAEQDALEKDSAYQTGIKEARMKGMQEKEGLVQEAKEEEKRIIGEINAQVQAELAEIRTKIAGEAKAVGQSLEAELGTFADAIGKKILGRAM
ncbi:MAG: ATP synthase F0 subunit B [Desulfobacterales bacterium]